MNVRRPVLLAAALLTGNALTINLCWIYRFATTEACPWLPHSCFAWGTPWERLADAVKSRQLGANTLFRYEWRELASLSGATLALTAVAAVILWRLRVDPRRLRLRTTLLLVALAAVEFQGVRALWWAVDEWEEREVRKGSIHCIDTWIWDDEFWNAAEVVRP